MLDETFEKIADKIFEESLRQYEKDIDIDTSKIKSNEEFFVYIDQRMEALRAHNERFTSNLIKSMVRYLKNQE